MAIIEDLGITVTCNVTGAPLTEYDDPEPDHDISKAPDAQTSFKYVEVLDDAEFSIHLSVNKPSEWLKRSHEHALGFLVSVDGEIVQLPLLFRSHFPIQGRWTTDVVGKYRVSEGSSTGLLCKLRFASLQTVEDVNKTRVLKDMETARLLGVIKVVVWRSKLIGRSDYRPTNVSQTDLAIAEKALKGKAVSHRTQFAEGQVASLPTGCKSIRVDSSPIAAFFFKYRSRDALRDEMIIPRTPSPDPDEEQIDSLPEEEVRRLARERLREIREEEARTKKEQGPVSKRELSPIDLTSDGPYQLPKRPRLEIDLSDD